MNSGQEKFYHYILERVKPEKIEEAKALLAENFKKQQEGTFTQEDALQFVPKMQDILQPEKTAEVLAIAQKFGQQFSAKS